LEYHIRYSYYNNLVMRLKRKLYGIKVGSLSTRGAESLGFDTDRKYDTDMDNFSRRSSLQSENSRPQLRDEMKKVEGEIKDLEMQKTYSSMSTFRFKRKLYSVNNDVAGIGQATSRLANAASNIVGTAGNVANQTIKTGVDVAKTATSTALEAGGSVAKTAGGVVGGAAGGTAGALGGATAGAALGSVVPVVGTAIGALAGGLMGAKAGGSLGSKIGATPGAALQKAGENLAN
jgi:phage tail tape-measure protein